MKVIQNLEDVHQQSLQLGFRITVSGKQLLFSQVIQRKPLNIIHGKISRAVALKNGKNPDNTWRIQPRKNAGFIQKVGKGPLEILGVMLIIGNHAPRKRISVRIGKRKNSLFKTTFLFSIKSRTR